MEDPGWEYFDRKTFWPRPANMPSPLVEDIRCQQCGYDLRGLTYGRCPECGYPFTERTVFGTRLPWIHRAVIGFNDAYWRTISLVIAHPERFARDASSGTRLIERDGTYFRWLTIAIAFGPAMILTGFALGHALSGRALLWGLVAAAVLVAVWLDGITRMPVSLFRHQYLASDRLERVVAMSHYTCAPLVLMPLHLAAAALVLAARSLPLHDPVFVAIAVLAWLILAVVQIGLWLRAAAVLARRTMNTSGTDIAALLIAVVIGWAWKTAIYLVGMPVLMFWSAKYLQWI